MLNRASCILIAFVFIDKGTPLKNENKNIWGGESVAKYMQKFDKSKPRVVKTSPLTESTDSPESYDLSDLDYERMLPNGNRRHFEGHHPKTRKWEDQLANDKKTWGWPWHGDLYEWLHNQEEITRQTRRHLKNIDISIYKELPLGKFKLFEVPEWQEARKRPYKMSSTSKDWGWPFENDGTLNVLRELAKSLRKQKKD